MLETISRRKFELKLDAWVARQLGGDDYGIDLQVEIFRDNLATGELFAVQLKAQHDAGASPTATVKRTSLNYWRAQPMPTLIVLWNESSDTLWYRWAHHVPTGREPDSATRTFAMEKQWEERTLSEIENEVRAFRAIRELASHTPVKLLVHGDSFLGSDSGAVQSSISRLARGVDDLHVRLSSADVPFIGVEMADLVVRVGASGATIHELHYDGAAGAVGPEQVAADIFVKIAFILSDFGQLELLSLELLRRSASKSGMVLSSGVLADTMAILARGGKFSAVTSLLERSLTVPSPPREEAIIGVMTALRYFTPAERRALAKVVKENARSAPEGGQDFYNAANILRQTDAAQALALYERAAALDPTYRDRSYWWREKGSILDALGRDVEAEQCYRNALSLGDPRAGMVLAESLARRGQFVLALEMLEGQDLLTDIALARYRLLKSALEHIVNELGVTYQDLPDVVHHVEAGASNAETYERANDALRSHALDGWTHWAKVPYLDEIEAEKLPTLIAAAVGASYVPQIWDELTRGAITQNEWGLVEDALWCAREFCDEDFVEMLQTDSFLDRDTRRVLAFLYEAQPARPSESFELRVIENDHAASSIITPDHQPKDS